MDENKELQRIITEYGDLLYRICIVMLCNEADAQDAVQDVFCRFLEKQPKFNDLNHEKAWFIKVSQNICRDMLRFRIRHPKISIDKIESMTDATGQNEILNVLLRLPAKLKPVIYLKYVEGYKTSEIAEILGISEGAVKMRIKRALARLRIIYEEE